MTLRLNNWLENHYVVVVSSLISSIIVCLAVLAGLEARRTPHPQAWAMRPAEAGKAPAEAPPRETPEPQPQEPPGAPLEKPPGEAALEEPDEPGSRELPPQAPASPTAGSEDPPPMRRKLHDKPRPVTKPAPAPVEAEPAPPLTRETEKRAIRTLRPPGSRHSTGTYSPSQAIGKTISSRHLTTAWPMKRSLPARSYW